MSELVSEGVMKRVRDGERGGGRDGWVGMRQTKASGRRKRKEW